MGKNIWEKIVETHIVDETEKEIGIKVDQTLTQDATGTLCYLQFESLEVPSPKTGLSVSYVDHNTLQTGFENADDHIYLHCIAKRYGLFFSPPGNGICHQIHLERFGRPKATLIGSDSHTPTAGALGMLAFGCGGLEVAVCMAGAPFYIAKPDVFKIELKGKLSPWVSAKDVILELLRRFKVSFGVGKVFEYGGEGIKNLSVYDRATIANMGTELGLTTSVFPSDEITKRFLEAQGRENQFEPIFPDDDARYADVIEIDLGKIEPLVALPSNPDNVVPVKEIEGEKVDQVIVGSCTNSSYKDIFITSKILSGQRTKTEVGFAISPGSRTILLTAEKEGFLESLIKSGARILEPACGPCIGMGQAPPTGAKTLRTFNRNFKGRSGTESAEIFLSSCEVAAFSAREGRIVDPRRFGNPPSISKYPRFEICDLTVKYEPNKDVEIIRGPNIKPLFNIEGFNEDVIEKEVILKVSDNISTDHIMPAGSKILPLRSNIEALSQYAFSRIDPDFPKRAKEKGGGVVVGGENYGQGSSREHAAIVPRYLGVVAVIAKSFARIHRSNLINFGILPLTFCEKSDYELISFGDRLIFFGIKEALCGKNFIICKNKEKGYSIKLLLNITDRESKILKAGGLINYYKYKI